MNEYKVVNVGPLSKWQDLEGAAKGKVFIDGDLGSEFIGTSVNSTPPGGQSPFWHVHDKVEEIYIFLTGVGEMALDNDLVQVEAGTIVRVPAGIWRALHCPESASEPLTWLCMRGGGAALKDLKGEAHIDSDKPYPWS